MTDFILILPEIFVALTLAFVLFGEITYHGERVRLVGATALIGLAAAFVQTILTYRFGPAQIFNHTFMVDGLALFFKVLFIALAFLAVLAASQTQEVSSEKRAEYFTLVLASTLGMSVAAAASNILLAFLALQFVNLLTYFVAGYGKRSAVSIEGAIKYMVLSAVSAGLFLYGIAILFGHAHTLNLYEMHHALVATPLERPVHLVVFLLLTLALAFQTAAFPMYFWAPDVIEGAPTPASGFLSLGTRAAGIAVAIRLFIVVFAQPALSLGQWKILGEVKWTEILALISGLTMLVGALLALRQQAAKRMVGYLLVSQTGFLLLGILVLDQVGVAAILYNLVVELFSLIGIFFVLSFFFDEVRSDRLSDLKGVMGRAVPESICLVLFLLALVGVPPTPGFMGKFTLIGAAVRHQWWFLAGVAIFSSAICTVAVARLTYGLAGDLRQTYLQPFRPSFRRHAFLAGLVVPMLLISLMAEHVLNWAGRSLAFILW